MFNMREMALPKPWYRQFWPWFLIAPPLTAVVGGVITIWIAINNDEELVTTNYYQDGLEINRQLEKKQIARDMSIRATFLFADADRQLTLFLQGKMPTPEALTLKLTSPLEQDKDATFQLIKVNQNLFRSEYHTPLIGRFYVSLTPNDDLWRITGEVSLPKENSIVITNMSHAAQQ